MRLTTYLNFNGNCEEAFLFYQSVFGGEITSINRYVGSPMEIPQGMDQKIMHITLAYEDNQLMGCDDLKSVEMPINSSLMLEFMEVFVMDSIFEKLSTNGLVTMSLQDTFWGARFGMLTDKFGIRWMFSCDLN